MKKISKLRKIALDEIEQLQAQVEIEYNGQPGQGEHRIQALYQGQEIGYLTFVEEGNNSLSVDSGKVDDKYYGYEIEEMILDRFGYVLEQDYFNYSVNTHFESPEFELAFRRLVSSGLIPASALNNDNVTRNYNEEDQMRWNDSKDSLPDNVRVSRLKR